jgi:hypothetical protein
VFEVLSLKAVLFRLSLPVRAPLTSRPQSLNDRVVLVHAGLNKLAYGRPEENPMRLLSLQPGKYCANGVRTGQSIQAGPVDAGKADAMALVQERRTVSIGKVELIVEVYPIPHGEGAVFTTGFITAPVDGEGDEHLR